MGKRDFGLNLDRHLLAGVIFCSKIRSWRSTSYFRLSMIRCVVSSTLFPFFFPFPFIFLIFFVCALAETNRHPFDLPEAEAELVSGYNVEYSGMSFSLFFLGEYSSLIFMSAFTVNFFFVLKGEEEGEEEERRGNREAGYALFDYLGIPNPPLSLRPD